MVVFERSLEESESEKTVRGAVQDLIDSHALKILHQPIVEITTGKPLGVECLSRFPDAQDKGPDAWFNDAAQVGLGLELELLAIRAGLDTIRYLPRDAYLSVNAAPETVLSGRLEELLSHYADRQIVVELTEHSQVEDFAALKESLRRLKPYARIAIDDVGAGYSGLRHLVDLEPDLLKLDMSLTRDIH